MTDDPVGDEARRADAVAALTHDSGTFTIPPSSTWAAAVGAGEFHTIKIPEYSDWSCYLFGNKPGGCGLRYIPQKGNVPNFFVRWMMKVCLACTWVKETK